MKIRSYKKSGLPPGSLIHTGEETGDITVEVFSYDINNLQEKRDKESLEEGLIKQEKTTWINVVGVHNPDFLESFNRELNLDLHPLLLEDIMNTDQRTKLEDYEGHLFLVLKMLTFDSEKEEVDVEQVSLVLGENYVISFQEEEGDVFNGVRDRLRHGKGRIRKMKADYLLYVLMDAIVDNYFVITDEIGFEIDRLEEKILEDPDEEILERIYHLKSDILLLRRSILPLGGILTSLQQDPEGFISQTTQVYLRDIYDHNLRILENIDSYREMLNGLLDIYLSLSSNKMNEVMKILTIIATIFMPLTLITGIYGMNFRYMPELEAHYGYPITIFVMLVIAIVMLILFKKKDML